MGDGMPHTLGSGLSGNGSCGTSGSRSTPVVGACEPEVSTGTGVAGFAAIRAQPVPRRRTRLSPTVPTGLNTYLEVCICKTRQVGKRPHIAEFQRLPR